MQSFLFSPPGLVPPIVVVRSWCYYTQRALRRAARKRDDMYNNRPSAKKRHL